MLPLPERAKSAAQLAVRARALYDIWWLYESVDTRPRYASTINTYSEFFRYDIHALLVAMTVHVCMLYDKDNRTIGLMHLIKEVEQQNGKSARLASARTLADQVKATVKSMTFLRNHVFAHRNASIRYDGAFQKAAVKPNDIRDLIDISLKIANKILVELNERELIANPYVVEQTKRMLDHLSQTTAS
jgi:hypothetical protein